MPNPHAIAGRKFEHQTRDYLRGVGCSVIRSTGSRSPVDLVAIRSGEVFLVQCKRDGVLGPQEWNDLFDLAQSCGAMPVLASKPDYHGIHFERLMDRKVARAKAPKLPIAILSIKSAPGEGPRRSDNSLGGVRG